MSDRHRHNSGCYEVATTCHRGEHQHLSSVCYTRDNPGDPGGRERLVCSRPEHQHTGACQENRLVCGHD